jgi:hypothetical protein
MDIDVVEQNIQDISPDLLRILLLDKTTKQYIRWGSDNYIAYGLEYRADQEIKPELIIGAFTSVIQPRVSKSEMEQTKRTRDKAEVFTPSWVCNEQNNLVDAAWFGRSDVFNHALEKSWKTYLKPICFPKDKIWKDYVDARRMEIACGEAPYLVSRYDTVSGEQIPIKDRIGLLDRKLRVVGENTFDEDEWYIWTIRAFQSCYGYDFQGDNVLLARENLLYTFIEYAQERMGHAPSLQQIKKIANIISWNIWQMNGITMTAPFSKAEPAYNQMTVFDFLDMENPNDQIETKTNELACKIYDWRGNESIEFRSIVEGE